jgi:hypothetical protein
MQKNVNFHCPVGSRNPEGYGRLLNMNATPKPTKWHMYENKYSSRLTSTAPSFRASSEFTSISFPFVHMIRHYVVYSPDKDSSSLLSITYIPAEYDQVIHNLSLSFCLNIREP